MKYRDPSTGNFKDLHVKVSDTVPIGAIMEWTTETAPDGWLICDGSAISRTVYSQLFAVIGTTYGAGDGSTTFNIPEIEDTTSIIKAYQVVAVPGKVVNEYSESTKDAYSADYVNTKLSEIVESGSNANGNYIKYADGTLVQYGENTFGSSGTTADSYKLVTFPINFIATNYSIIAQTRYFGGSGSGDALSTLLTPSKGSVSNNDIYRRLSFLSADDSGQSALYAVAQPFYWYAIGRWK